MLDLEKRRKKKKKEREKKRKSKHRDWRLGLAAWSLEGCWWLGFVVDRCTPSWRLDARGQRLGSHTHSLTEELSHRVTNSKVWKKKYISSKFIS